MPGENLSMARRPCSSKLEDGNQFAGHATRLWWDGVTSLRIQGGPSASAVSSHASGAGGL